MELRSRGLSLKAGAQCQTKNRRGRPWKANGEKLTERITIRLSQSELEALRRLAGKSGLKPSSLIRILISRAMGENAPVRRPHNGLVWMERDAP